MAPKLPSKKPKIVKNSERAIVNGKIATIYKGKRIVQKYYSGEPLKGRIEN